MKTIMTEAAAEAVVEYAKENGIRFVFISGNGGSGKTEFAKQLIKQAQKYGHANAIDMDDFVVDTALRKSASMTWTDEGKVFSGRCTTAFKAAYFLQNIHAIIANIANGNDYLHWPKKALDFSECVTMYGDACVTVIEGIGSVYLNKNLVRAVNVFMECDSDVEIARRLSRKRFSNEQNLEDIKKNAVERNSQFRALILPHREEHELILKSNEDFSVSVIKDLSEILK